MPGGELVLYADWDDIRRRRRRELADADVAIVTSYLPATASRRPSSCSTRRAPLRVFYDLDTPVTLSRLDRGESRRLYRPARPARFRSGAELHRRRRARRSARRLGARRVAPLYGRVDPDDPPADRGRGPIRCRPVLSRHLCRRPAGGARGAVHRAGAAAARAALPDRRRAVPAGLSLDGQHLLRPPPAAGRAPGLLRLVAADAERHPRGDGRDGLVPVGAAVRGGGLRRRRCSATVGGARRLLRARPRDPGRAHDRGRARRARSQRRELARNRRGRRASAPWPSTPPTAARATMLAGGDRGGALAGRPPRKLPMEA